MADEREWSLSALVKAVDSVLEAVETPPLPEPVVYDEAQSFLVAAYGRTYRCMRAIRDLAAWPRSDADHALVLTRSLVTTVATSLWMAAPEHSVDRLYRFEQWRYSYAIERERTLTDWKRQGFELGPGALQQAQAAVANGKAAGIERVPSDGRLLKELGLGAFYPRVHRPGSDAAHFSLGSAAGSFAEPVTPGVLEGRSIAMQFAQPESAQEALALAFITYGQFLEGSEPVIGHGLTDLAARLLREWIDEYID